MNNIIKDYFLFLLPGNTDAKRLLFITLVIKKAYSLQPNSPRTPLNFNYQSFNPNKPGLKIPLYNISFDEIFKFICKQEYGNLVNVQVDQNLDLYNKILQKRLDVDLATTFKNDYKHLEKLHNEGKITYTFNFDKLNGEQEEVIGTFINEIEHIRQLIDYYNLPDKVLAGVQKIKNQIPDLRFDLVIRVASVLEAWKRIDNPLFKFNGDSVDSGINYVKLLIKNDPGFMTPDNLLFNTLQTAYNNLTLAVKQYAAAKLKLELFEKNITATSKEPVKPVILEDLNSLYLYKNALVDLAVQAKNNFNVKLNLQADVNLAIQEVYRLIPVDLVWLKVVVDGVDYYVIKDSNVDTESKVFIENDVNKVVPIG